MHHIHMLEASVLVVTPRTCARGKVIGRVVIVVIIVHKKIARSWDLGTSETRKYNESVDVGEKTGLRMLRIEWYGLQASQIVYFSWLS